MSARKSTLFDVSITFLTKMVFLGGSFIISIILARLLGPEGKGVVTALFVIPNVMISLADLGVRQASTYYIGKNIYKTEDVVASNLLLWLITSVISIAVVLIYFNLPFSDTYPVALILIVSAYIPVKILIAYFNGILQGKQMITNFNMKFIVEFISRLTAVILLVWLFQLDVLGAALATLVSVICVVIYSGSIVSRFTKIRLYYAQNVPQALLKKGFFFALALFILQLNYKVDIMFLESMVPSSDIGLYSVGVTLAELIWQVPSAISTVLFARSANSKSDKKSTERTAKLLRVSWIPLIAMASIFWIFSPIIVRVLYGEAFVGSANVIRLILPGILMMVLHKVLYADVAGKGKPLLVLNIYVLSLLLNIGLNLYLIPLMGINGAALASTTSYIFSAVLFSIKYHKFSGIAYRDLFILKKDDVAMLKRIVKR